MLQIIFKNIVTWYLAKNRWWLALPAGFLYPLCLPPFNGGRHSLLTGFPLLSLIALVPLFLFALTPSRKRALLYCYCFSVTCCLGQYYWIINDTAEGVWHLIVFGLFATSAYIGLFYTASAMLFRFFFRLHKLWALIAAPGAWVCVEYLRAIGEFSFPWTFAGYTISQFLSMAQLASVTGVFGLSFIVIFANVLIVNACIALYNGRPIRRALLSPAIFLGFLAAIGWWGFIRSHRPLNNSSATIALIQSNMDQNHWGNNSLDTCLSVTQSMIFSAAIKQPDLIVLPESAIFCYLARSAGSKRQVVGWFDSTRVPLVLGTLHWDMAPPGSSYPYLVYNAAFLLDSASRQHSLSADWPTSPFLAYYKIKLVPFSEIIPLQGLFPILSRVNLGQADFKPGVDSTIFTIGHKIRAIPLICYEIIYPDFVRRRVNRSTQTNLIVNITNDGWWGRSSGPYQHAAMSRLRCIENGIAMARSANSGVCMLVDAYGRVALESEIYKRDVFCGSVPLQRVVTLYSRYGDWPVLASWIIMLAALIIIGASKAFFPKRTA